MTIMPSFVCQVILLVYHQITTLFDLHPFNGARHYSRREKIAEAGSNLVLMSLAPIGYIFQIKSLINFGLFYYPILFAIELIIWWIPYFFEPSGTARTIYNGFLAGATSNFEKGDTLEHWKAIFAKIHRGTITFLPVREDRPVPNLEHTILHVWTLITAIVTVTEHFNHS